MKTGASESYDKLPAHLLTSLQCLPDFLLFSDLEQQMGKYHLHDVLDGVADTVKSANKEFALYEAQLSCPVSQKQCTKDLEGAWNLDKYKFINMLVRTWAMRPGRKWYVFAEADSYVFWPNLMLWLRTRAEPDADVYVGNVALANGFPFAHGGSGYVISGQLVKRVVESIPGLATKYAAAAPATCCGDVLMGKALAEVGVTVRHALPMFNGERTNTLPFGEGHWCEPILTLHHMDAEQVGLAWQFEQTRTKTSPIQIRDLYHQFFAPNLVPTRDAWDNLSQDVCYIAPDTKSQDEADQDFKAVQKNQPAKTPVERDAHTSPAACAAVCEAAGLDVPERDWAARTTDDARAELLAELYGAKSAAHDESAAAFHKNRRCFQWRHHRGVCCTAESFKLGRPRRGDDKGGGPWTSGWFVRGINDWIKAKGECDVRWQEPE
ncbi:glycosyltransferase family 31 [Ophiocordyceps sinensis CO18]|uniref:Glycosyltransferase family 31 n=1 Tax=Ophiocordyceps sinensis (strain Co18 / CGMCC 3.14243) TaxID=911162 RepID=T5ADM1_OPHSC|nr:glycosyltransferase family 31 [Ophiocordyceps sinensis CO18]